MLQASMQPAYSRMFMNNSQIEALETKVNALKQAMVSVASFSSNIIDIDTEYKRNFEDVDLEISILSEQYPELVNPNEFSSLWDWYNFYSAQPQYKPVARKCAYVFNMYAHFSVELRVVYCDQYFATASDETKDSFISPENAQHVVQKINEIAALMQKVATSEGGKFAEIVQEYDELYQEKYKELDMVLLTISRLGFHMPNPNKFTSLWQWYDLWRSEFPRYAERRQYVDDLYRELLRSFKVVYKKLEVVPSHQLKFKEVFESQFKSENFGSLKKGRTADATSLVTSLEEPIREEKITEPPVFSTEAKTPVDFVILTALKIEREKLCETFEISQRMKKGSRIYWHVDFPLNNGSHYKIIVAQCTGMGNISSSSSASDIFHDWNPKAILMVGVAGAAREDQNLGDIILGRAVSYYEFGKVIDGAYSEEQHQHRSDATLWNHLQALPNWETPILTVRPDNLGVRPDVHEGVIASGEKRISDAGVRDAIASLNSEIVGIEMEGYGVSEVAWQSGKKCLVIRSICDMADSSENNDWHPYAAAAAASFTRHFLLDCPLAPMETNIPSDTSRVFNSFSSTENNDEFSRFDFLEIADFLERSGRAVYSARRSLCILIDIRSTALPFMDGTSDQDFSIQLLNHLCQINAIESTEKLCKHLLKYLYGKDREKLEGKILQLRKFRNV